MKRFLLILLALLTLCTALPGLDMTATAADSRKIWATVGDSNVHLLPSGYDKNVKKYARGTLTEERSWTDWAWKNDHANARLDFYTLSDDIPQASLSASDLTTKSGAVIKSENVTVTYLSKVNTLSEAYPDIDYEVFDVISHENTRTLEAEMIHEAWVDIYVPKDAEAGTYSGKIYLRSGDETLAQFTYKLEVIDLELADPENWETYLELWTVPHASNRYYSGLSNAEYFGFPEGDNGTNPYSYCDVRLNRDYEAGLESQLELYHQAGGNVITVSVVEDPGNSRNPCPFPSMVKWTRKKNGKFSFDYTDMDYWVELNMKHGINRQINLHSIAGFAWGFVYKDEASGTVKHEGSVPGEPRWEQISREFLTDLIAHLEKKGWFDITCLQMDERTLSQTSALIKVAKSVKNSEGKTLKVGGAVNSTELAPIFDDLHDISIWENSLPDNIKELAEQRREKGLRTTVYSCGAGKMATPCNPGEAAYAVYDSLKYKTDGVLRWALDKFDEDPLHADCHKVTYPGDCYLIYPDERDSGKMQAQSSPRFEKLREGMRDVEKLRYIKKNYPDFAEAVDELAASVGQNSMTNDVVRLRSRVFNMSKAVFTLSENKFTDVKEGKWYMEAVRFSVMSGLMNGVSETLFAPNDSMTRAMFVTVLARMDGAKLDNGAKPIFDDVPTGKWYTGAIVWATRSSLVDGVAPGKFAPNSPLTREQTATLLLRYAQRKEYDTEPRADIKGYEDYRKIGSYARDAFSWANAKGIIKGVSATRLDPKGNCTRAQVAEMLRLFNKNIIAAQ